MTTSKIAVIEGDITQQQVEAVVNAANSSLLGGGGVDGAIHRAAGSGLLEECQGLKGCQTGDAKITKGYNLPANWVIHTVGPVWKDGTHHEDELLASCYRRSLELAEEYNIRSIAFPAISTGVYRFPAERAARIAVKTVQEFLASHPAIEQVIFVCFSSHSYNCHRAAVEEIIVSRSKP
jgi:O-acetyl-ADP-ribose deacetylase (regulator of RNase III)